jgi:head-tail adaptor
MKAGLMRHWLRLEQPTVTADAFGGVVKAWAAVAEVDAAIDSVSGREFLAADRELAGVTWRITIRETPDFTVEPNWRGVEVDGDAARVFDFVALLPSHDRDVLTIAATGGTSQP